MPIAKNVRKLTPYTPGEQPRSKRVVKLNTNENPYPPSPKCMKAMASVDPDRLRRYPDPECRELREALAAFSGASPDCIFVGNGSDEILTLAARAFVEDGASLASLDPSYSLYKTLAAIRGVEWRGYGDLPSARALRADGVQLFLLTNPNAPTGAMKPAGEVAAFARRFRGVVLVDEAYADFASSNCMPLATAGGNANLIVMRTFSKSFSLAGLRVGWCVGPRPLIEALYKVKDSYNVDFAAQRVATAAARDAAWMRRNAAKVAATRAWFSEELRSLGWDVPPSEANFVFARPANAPAAEVFRRLRSRGIYVRHFPGPKTGDRLRITIGTDPQMRRFLAAAKKADGVASKEV